MKKKLVKMELDKSVSDLKKQVAELEAENKRLANSLKRLSRNRDNAFSRVSRWQNAYEEEKRMSEEKERAFKSGVTITLGGIREILLGQIQKPEPKPK